MLLVFHNRTANLPVSGQKLGVDLLCHSGSCVFHQLPDFLDQRIVRRQLVRHRIPPYFIGIPCCRFALIYQYILFLAESKTPKTRGNVLLALRRHNRAKLSFRTNLIYKISTKVKSKIAGTSLPAMLHFLFSRTPHPGSQTAGPAPCSPARRQPSEGPPG